MSHSRVYIKFKANIVILKLVKFFVGAGVTRGRIFVGSDDDDYVVFVVVVGVGVRVGTRTGGSDIVPQDGITAFLPVR